MFVRLNWAAVGAVCGSLYLAACTPVNCPPGKVEQSGRCVPPEEAAQDGGTEGGSPDAGDASLQVDGSEAGTSGSGGGGAGGSATDLATAGTSGASGVGGSSAPDPGVAGGAAEPAATDPPCTMEGALRCSALGAGGREQCSGGTWGAGDPCASGETCLAGESGEPSCVLVSDLCVGSGGQTVCDAQGTLIVCNADESIAMMMACSSPKHCQAGVATNTCATCLPQMDHRCTGTSLEECAPDGLGFVPLEDCPTEGLCNELLGECTDAVCEPGTTTCAGSMLVTCNADGTEIASMMTCPPGMCDAEGGDCNMCEPGTKTCQGDMVMTCDPTGQTIMGAACPSGMSSCIGMGQCVQCDDASDCEGMTQGCKVGVCMGNRCAQANAQNGIECSASGGKPGKCSSGTCECTPQCAGKECGDDGCDGECGPCRGQVCDTARSQCVECVNDTHCSAGHCSGNECVECANDTHCPSGHCSGNECVECANDMHCSSGHCLDQACVECRSDTHCTSGHCVENECVDCVNDGDCEPQRCLTASCSNGGCRYADAPEGTECGDGRACDQNGDCMPVDPIYDQCNPDPDTEIDPCTTRGKEGNCASQGYCAPLCGTDADCPPIRGATVMCQYLCIILCPCPDGMNCNADNVCEFP